MNIIVADKNTVTADTRSQQNMEMWNISEGENSAAVSIVDCRASKIRRIDSFSRQVSIDEADGAAEWDPARSNEGLDSGSDASIESDIDSDDEDFSDEELSDDNDEDGMNEETLSLIKSNDASMTSLAVHHFSDDIINGKEAGHCIGTNTHLTKLAIKGESMEWDSTTRAGIMEFSTGIASNRSIEHLSLEECILGDGTAANVVSTLMPIFEQNDHLHSLDIIGCDIGDEGTQLLASSLSRRCNPSSFRRIILDANKISDTSAGELIRALEGYPNLAKLSLGDNEIGRRGCIALGNLLSSPKRNLKELNLENNLIGDEGIAILTTSLNNNTTLKDLNLSFNCNITQAGWCAFSTCLQNTNSAIAKLDVSSTNIADEGVTALGQALSNNTKLKTLNCYDLNSDGVPLVTATGWRSFFSCLGNNPMSALKQIDLRYSSIDEGGLVALANALGNNSTVKMLDLSHNLQINSTGWQSFFTCLESSNFALEELHLQGNNVTDKVVDNLTQALIKNETLETLVLGSLLSLDRTSWVNFAHLLCNKSSINSICASNHTLCHVGHQEVTSHVNSLLALNKSGSCKKDVVRDKILQNYYQNGTENIQELLGINLKVLPCAISWIGRNDTGCMLLYQLLRSLPLMFISEKKMRVSGAKRKMPRHQ